jgi:hypothetical protein
MLGALLMGQGLITAQQLEEALNRQRRGGGRLGTNLVELGHIDVDGLARALSAQQRVPAVLSKHVVAIDPKIIAILPAKIAAALNAIPLGYTLATPKRLIVALRDPATTPLDEIAFMASTRIDPGVAPELLIRQCLETYYNVISEERSLAMSIGSVIDSPPSWDAIIPEVSGQPVEARPAATPEPRAPVSRPKPATLSAPPPPPSRAAELAALEQAIEAERAAEEIRPDDGALLSDEDAWDDLPAPPASQPEAPAGMLRPVLDVDEAIAAMRAATSREDIGETLATWLESTCGSGLVLIVKDGTALGWKGYMPDVERELIESIAMPLGPPSMLTAAYEKRTPVLAPPPAEGMALQSRLWKLLRCKAPSEVVVAPVVVGNRVVNLLYAHPEGDAALAPTIVEEITRIAAAASAEYVRLIRART